ncbi:MAG: TetR/AcrR family transcriptional regulator [Pseudomonadota bacterium]
MKISKEKAADNRRALVKAAAKLFKEKGIDGVGVAEISKEAGLTHGALYAHFASKEALAAEALEYSLARGYAMLTPDGAARPVTLNELYDYYLSTRQRDSLSGGCAMTAAASEIARQDESVSARFTEGFMRMAGYLEGQLADTDSQLDKRERALTMLSAMIGGVAVSRAVLKADPALSDEILAAMRKLVGELSDG